MIKLELNLQGPIAATLLESVMSVGRKLPNGLAREFSLPEEDEELQAFWLNDLQNTLSQEYSLLVKLLRDEALKEEVHELSDDDAEAILRSAAAIRLALRTQKLNRIDDKTLENGMIQIEKMNDDEKRAFFCYIFLSDLQIRLIQAMDPEALDTDFLDKNE